MCWGRGRNRSHQRTSQETSRDSLRRCVHGKPAGAPFPDTHSQALCRAPSPYTVCDYLSKTGGNATNFKERK